MSACRRAALLAAIVVAACSDETSGPTTLGVSDVAATPNPTNALAAFVSARVAGADSVRVRYWRSDAPPADSGTTTPAVAVPRAAEGAPVRLPVLGLDERTAYRLVMEAVVRGSAGRAASDTARFTTGALPEALRNLRVTWAAAPGQGYLLVGKRAATTVYAAALAPSGRVVWYRGFEYGLGGPGEIKQQPNGDYTVFLGSTSGWNPTLGYYVQFRPDGELVRTIQAPTPLYTDNHELQLTFSDTTLTGAYFFGYSLERVDLSAVAGPPDSLLALHQLMRWTPRDGATTVYDTRGQYTLQDWIEPGRFPPFDLAHPNSADVAADGTVLVSWRNLGEVALIDPATRAVRWRLGGRRSTFTIVGDPLGGFSAQHCARLTGPDRVMVFDNGTRHVPPVSRAVEYQLDTRANTATMIWSYTHPDRFYVPFTGCATRLPSGNTLVYFSAQSHAIEVTPTGQVVSDGTILDGSALLGAYRATRIASLYGRPPAR